MIHFYNSLSEWYCWVCGTYNDFQDRKCQSCNSLRKNGYPQSMP